MPNVQITIRKGRSTEEIRDLVTRVTDAIGDSLSVDLDRVRILVHELDPERIAHGGELAADKPSRP